MVTFFCFSLEEEELLSARSLSLLSMRESLKSNVIEQSRIQKKNEGGALTPFSPLFFLFLLAGVFVCYNTMMLL
jgi:hypothetical protein